MCEWIVMDGEYNLRDYCWEIWRFWERLCFEKL